MVDPEMLPEMLQEAERRLRAFLERRPSYRRRVPGGAESPVWQGACELLARRIARAEAEDLEATRLGARPQRERELVLEILERDLAHSRVAPIGRMVSECDELVLVEQSADPGLRASFVGRCYGIHDAADRELGEVQQLFPRTRGSLLDLCDLHFQAIDRTIGRTFTFRRSGDPIYLFDELGAQLGFVSSKAGAPLEGFKILSSLDRGMMQVKWNASLPFSLSVLASSGDEIGTIERRFVGLGPFLREANQLRIRVRPGKVSAGQRWGLIVTALLAGIEDEMSPSAGRS